MKSGRAVEWVGLSLLCALASLASADDTGLTLTDIPAYRAALEHQPDGSAIPVTFRELWDNPKRYEGMRVRVEGHVARRFRQASFGTFPALAEVWINSPAGDPFCIVFPGAAEGAEGAVPGSNVRFEGTYLKRLRYRGADTDRLAPLIVGDRPPAVLSPAPKPSEGNNALSGSSWTRLDWVIGLGAATVVLLVLARRHLTTPSRPKGVEEVPPEFLENR